MRNMYSSIFNEVFSIGLKNKTKLETVIYNSKDESRKVEK